MFDQSEAEKSKIVQWYKGKNIFITGGTGFMGKVLVEKLLYSFKDIGNLYILMRTKRDRTPEQRVEDIWKLPLFSRVREVHPDAKKKIKPIYGDLVTENLGIKEEDMQILINNVTVIFHCAATLKLEATLKDAVEQNTAGTLRVLDIIKRIKKVDAFLHMSTAFCSADVEEFEEKIYMSRDDPRNVIDVTRWMSSDALIQATPALIAPHPNTYTYSKRLGECLVAQDCKDMRVAVVRPSIVIPAASEPLPGWVDSLNGPMGLLVAGGKGVLRSMHCQGHFNAQLVPVDIAINSMLVIAYNLGSAKEKPQEVPVYNLTIDGIFHLTWKQILDTGKQAAYKYPFEQMIWYPDGDIRSSYFVHRLYCIFCHWLPAYLIDGLMFIFGQKRFMIRVQTKIHDGLELLQFFTNRQWNFRSEKFLALNDNLSEWESKMFQMDPRNPPIPEYMVNCVLGARQYCMKENLKSLTRCRIQQAFLYLLHKGLVFAFYYWVIMTIYGYSQTAQDAVESITDYAKDFGFFSRN